MNDNIKEILDEYGFQEIDNEIRDSYLRTLQVFDERDKLQSNWNSLRECIKKEIKKLLDIMDKDKIEGFELTVFQNAINRYKFVLDKMNELEREN